MNQNPKQLAHSKTIVSLWWINVFYSLLFLVPLAFGGTCEKVILAFNHLSNTFKCWKLSIAIFMVAPKQEQFNLTSIKHNQYSI